MTRRELARLTAGAAFLQQQATAATKYTGALDGFEDKVDMAELRRRALHPEGARCRPDAARLSRQQPQRRPRPGRSSFAPRSPNCSAAFRPKPLRFARKRSR